MSDKSSTTDLVTQLRVGEMCAPPCRMMEARSGCLCAAAADEIERLRAREAHLLEIIRCYNSDDALFDHEKVVSDVT
jgi:hypothetical protein